jgi:phosphopantetheine adenylyltransferase
MRQANVNLAFGGQGIDTVLLFASDQHVMTSSTYIKQIFELGRGDAARIKRLVPDNVAEALARKLGNAVPAK